MAPDEALASDACITKRYGNLVAVLIPQNFPCVDFRWQVFVLTVVLLLAFWTKCTSICRKSRCHINASGHERKGVTARASKQRNGSLHQQAQGVDQKHKWLKHPTSTTDDCDQVIVRLAKEGNPCEAHRGLRQLVRFGFQFRQGTFTTLLHAYSKAGSIAQVVAVVDDMKSAGLKFDAVTYNMIIDAWARAGDAPMAQLWLRRMLAEGVHPNVVSFSIVIRACAAANLLEDLEKWFKRSQELSFHPNLVSLQSAARIIANRNDAANAMKLLRVAVEHGVRPKIDCLMAVFDSIDYKEDVDLTSELVDIMRASHEKSDGKLLSRCIMLAARAGHGTKAQQWAEECVAERRSLSAPARRCLIRAGLKVPEFRTNSGVSSAPDADNAEGGAEAENKFVKVSTHSDKGRRNTEEEARQAARWAANGKRFSGIIKDFQPRRFGHITCVDTYDLFQKDVFMSRWSNPRSLSKGQRVSFVLYVTENGLPQAEHVELIQPSVHNPK